MKAVGRGAELAAAAAATGVHAEEEWVGQRTACELHTSGSSLLDGQALLAACAWATCPPAAASAAAHLEPCSCRLHPAFCRASWDLQTTSMQSVLAPRPQAGPQARRLRPSSLRAAPAPVRPAGRRGGALAAAGDQEKVGRGRRGRRGRRGGRRRGASAPMAPPSRATEWLACSLTLQPLSLSRPVVRAAPRRAASYSTCAASGSACSCLLQLGSSAPASTGVRKRALGPGHLSYAAARLAVGATARLRGAAHESAASAAQARGPSR